MLDPIKRFTEELRALNRELYTPGLKEKKSVTKRIENCFEESEKYRKLFCNTSSFKPMDELSEQLEKLKTYCEVSGLSKTNEKIREAVSRLPLRVFQLGESLDLQRLTVGQEGFLTDKEYVSLVETNYKTRQFAKRKENLLYSIHRGVPIRYLMNTEEELKVFLREQGKDVYRLNLDGCAAEKPGLPKPKFSLTHLDLRGTSFVLMRRTYLHLLDMGVQVQSDSPFPWDDPERPPLSVNDLKYWKREAADQWKEIKPKLETAIAASDLKELERNQLLQEVASISEDNLMSVQLSSESLYQIILHLNRVGGIGREDLIENFIEAYCETNPTDYKQIKSILRACVDGHTAISSFCREEILKKLSISQLKEIVFDRSFIEYGNDLGFLMESYLKRYQILYPPKDAPTNTPKDAPTKEELQEYLKESFSHIDGLPPYTPDIFDVFVKGSFGAEECIELWKTAKQYHSEILTKIKECFEASKPTKKQILESGELGRDLLTQNVIRQLDMGLLKTFVFEKSNFDLEHYPALMNEYLARYETSPDLTNAPTKEQLECYLKNRPTDAVEYGRVLDLFAKNVLTAEDYLPLFARVLGPSIRLEGLQIKVIELFIASKPTKEQFVESKILQKCLLTPDIVQQLDIDIGLLKEIVFDQKNFALTSHASLMNAYLTKYQASKKPEHAPTKEQLKQYLNSRPPDIVGYRQVIDLFAKDLLEAEDYIECFFGSYNGYNHLDSEASQKMAELFIASQPNKEQMLDSGLLWGTPGTPNMLGQLNMAVLKEFVFDQSNLSVQLNSILTKEYLTRYQESKNPEHAPTKEQLKSYLENESRSTAEYVQIVNLFAKDLLETEDYIKCFFSHLGYYSQDQEAPRKMAEFFIASQPTKEQILNSGILQKGLLTPDILGQLDMTVLKDLVFQSNFHAEYYPALMNEYLRRCEKSNTAANAPTREQLKRYLANRSDVRVECKRLIKLFAKDLLEAKDYIEWLGMFHQTLKDKKEDKEIFEVMAELFIASQPTKEQLKDIIWENQREDFLIHVIQNIDIEYLKEIKRFDCRSEQVWKEILERIKSYAKGCLKAEHQDYDQIKEALLLCVTIDKDLLGQMIQELNIEQLKKIAFDPIPDEFDLSSSFMEEYLARCRTSSIPENAPTKEQLKHYLQSEAAERSFALAEDLVDLFAGKILDAEDYTEELFKNILISHTLSKHFIASKPTKEQIVKSGILERGYMWDVINLLDMGLLQELAFDPSCGSPQMHERLMSSYLTRCKKGQSPVGTPTRESLIECLKMQGPHDNNKLQLIELFAKKLFRIEDYLSLLLGDEKVFSMKDDFVLRRCQEFLALNPTIEQLKQLILSKNSFLPQSAKLEMFCRYLTGPKVVDDPDFRNVVWSRGGWGADMVLKAIIEKNLSVENVVIAKLLIDSHANLDRLLKDPKINGSKQMKEVIDLLIQKNYR
jgi:hypothetical protein